MHNYAKSFIELGTNVNMTENSFGARPIEGSVRAGLRFIYTEDSVSLECYTGTWNNKVRPLSLSEAVALDFMAAVAMDHLAAVIRNVPKDLKRKRELKNVLWTGLGVRGIIIRPLPKSDQETFGLLFRHLEGNEVGVSFYLSSTGWQDVIPSLSINELVAIRCLCRDAIEFLRKIMED